MYSLLAYYLQSPASCSVFGTGLTGGTGDRIRCCRTALWVDKGAAKAGKVQAKEVPITESLRDIVSVEPKSLNKNALEETETYAHDPAKIPASNTV